MTPCCRPDLEAALSADLGDPPRGDGARSSIWPPGGRLALPVSGCFFADTQSLAALPRRKCGCLRIDELKSLGAVAYYLLTGRPPFAECGRAAVLIAHARDPVEPPSHVRPGVPQDLERVVLRCLAKHPDERFPDALALEQALGACACAGDWDQGRATRWWQGEFGDPS